ncbi:GCN5-related N-acetyltransferase 6, chloroplastic isoform X1 [Euphorbia lathyris]|uniref:GCN5-related N-acetyltransferase 6, chloroplastic isoform X1 n=1 Tax=Euphorbia lathyris TaxID=212925 RepID=UPI0033130EB9
MVILAEAPTSNWYCALSTTFTSSSSGPPPDRPEILSFPNDGFRYNQRFHRIGPSLTMAMDSRSFPTKRKEELSIQLPEPSIPQFETSRLPDLRFDRLQVPEKELLDENKLEFGQFVAREAVIDEELWTAAWLRAESHLEDRMNDRYVDNYKRKFADQEFHAIKKRRVGLHGQNCKCLVTVKKDDKNVKRTVLKSVVGTLDLSIRCLLQGETFPGERVKLPVFRSIYRRGPHSYGYVANLCVSKSARRQGIASNMLQFAVESAKFEGVEHLYVHVHRNNRPARELYEKMGFEMIEAATEQLQEEQTYLLCYRV